MGSFLVFHFYLISVFSIQYTSGEKNYRQIRVCSRSCIFLEFLTLVLVLVLEIREFSRVDLEIPQSIYALLVLVSSSDMKHK